MVALSVHLIAGCSDSELVDDQNPYYVQGIRHRGRSEYESAVKAFEKCLRLSPGSADAHLQLGMLYEDHLQEPIRALYHYREYARKRPDGESAEVAEKSVTRIEKRLAEEWAALYGVSSDDPELVAKIGELQDQVEKLMGQKKFLLAKLRETNARLVSARRRLDSQTAATRASTEPESTAARVMGSLPEEKTYTIRPGDSLISIARREYGDGSLWEELRDYNAAVLDGGETIAVGEQLKIPPRNRLQK